MSEQANSPTLIVIAAFGLALVGTALGFGAYNQLDDLALGLARVEMVGAAVTRKNLDAAHERIVSLETRVASLEAQLAAAKAAPPPEE
jgi:hypothetical protein